MQDVHWTSEDLRGLIKRCSPETDRVRVLTIPRQEVPQRRGLALDIALTCVSVTLKPVNADHLRHPRRTPRIRRAPIIDAQIYDNLRRETTCQPHCKFEVPGPGRRDAPERVQRAQGPDL